MKLPGPIEQLRHVLAATPGVGQFYASENGTFFLSGEAPGQMTEADVVGYLAERVHLAEAPEFDVHVTVVRLTPGRAGGTYFETFLNVVRATPGARPANKADHYSLQQSEDA